MSYTVSELNDLAEILESLDLDELEYVLEAGDYYHSGSGPDQGMNRNPQWASYRRTSGGYSRPKDRLKRKLMMKPKLKTAGYAGY